MLGRLDGVDEDQNRLGYVYLRNRSILQKNEDEMRVQK